MSQKSAVPGVGTATLKRNGGKGKGNGFLIKEEVVH